jgi:hypothetical protein
MSVASGNPLTQQLNPHTQHLALPLHIQRLQRVLDVCPYLQQLEDILKENETKPLTQYNISFFYFHLSFNLEMIQKPLKKLSLTLPTLLPKGNGLK